MKAIVDCNNFYCSCERLFRPDLEAKPVVVLSNNDGCIISRSDEAKQLGIGMASPYYQNRHIIEEHKVAVFSSNYGLYGDLSMRVMDTLRYLLGPAAVEVYSVDEAFLDIPDNLSEAALHNMMKRIKHTVEMWTGIRVSVGAAPSKVLAKLANRLAKKDKKGSRGIWVLDTEEKIKQGLEATPVDELWGVGRQYAVKLHNLGIDDGWQLRHIPEEWARVNLGGVVGVRLIRELKGIPCIPMKDPLDTKKMIATTRMFGTPVYELKDLREAVATYTARAAEKLRRQYGAASQVDVFVVTNGRREQRYIYKPQSRHRQCTLSTATADTGELIRAALPLVDELFEPGLKYLKAGVVLGQITPVDSVQGNLFRPVSDATSLMSALDNINFAMRGDSVKFLCTGLRRNWKMRQQRRSRLFTTRWNELYELK